MPFKRRSFRKRTKRTYRKRRGQGRSNLRMQLKRIGITAPTHKYNDYADYFSLGTPSITPATGPSPFNGSANQVYNYLTVRIGAGDQVDDRNNNIIFLKTLRFRMCLQASNDLTAEVFTPPYNCRVMLVLDKQQISDDLQTGLSEVLQQTATDWAAMVSYLNVTGTRGRFKVLYDRTFRFSGQTTALLMDSASTAADVTQAYGLKDINFEHTKTFKGRGLPIVYNGDATTDIQKNGLFWLMFTDNQLAATNPCLVSMNVRSVFVENL